MSLTTDLEQSHKVPGAESQSLVAREFENPWTRYFARKKRSEKIRKLLDSITFAPEETDLTLFAVGLVEGFVGVSR